MEEANATMYAHRKDKTAMFAAMYGSNPYNSIGNPCKEVPLSGTAFSNVIHDEYRAVEKSVFGSAVRNQDSLKSGDLEALAKKTAEKQAEVKERQAKEKLVELVKVTKWNRVDGAEGSLLSTFPKETKREMLNTLKMVKSGVPHKYKNQYGKNIENKIAVLEYLLMD